MFDRIASEVSRPVARENKKISYKTLTLWCKISLMPIASCHCKNIKIRIAQLPASVIECNCSICSRLGSRWAEYPLDKISIESKLSAPVIYSWGDKCINFCHCPICGCTTHYLTNIEAEPKRFKLNARMLEPPLPTQTRIRKFDGADSWKFIDE